MLLGVRLLTCDLMLEILKFVASFWLLDYLEDHEYDDVGVLKARESNSLELKTNEVFVFVIANIKDIIAEDIGIIIFSQGNLTVRHIEYKSFPRATFDKSFQKS